MLTLRAVLIGVGLGVAIDLAGAYLWLCFYDGPDFPY